MAELTPMRVESDQIGPETVRVYRVRTEDEVEMAVTRLGSGASAGVPVVLVHGTFCQRSFWVSSNGCC